ncbi:CDP-glycerol glycerophosphotransferase family protein [Pseudoalteromonas sp. T1lg65]|uniref:CDP-glycerol glycerophosphotransferase family protein n=1 Tax=Pseudoalteromonas sp. T1lg65 TaxID=2077101 RepID=UPI003F792FA7
MNVCFDVLHLYYLPQYLPVIAQCRKQGIEVALLCYENKETKALLSKVVSEQQLSCHWVDDPQAAYEYYSKSQYDWIVFGNAYPQSESLLKTHKLALMQHGIGPKSCYYDVSRTPTTVRFVEGQHRLNKLQQMFPNGEFYDSGFAKLDPVLNGEDVGLSVASLGLDTSKKTILYAPTFYPSSIEMLPDDLPQRLSQYNIIIKPHQFSMEKAKYAKQRRKLAHFADFDNVYLTTKAEFNLTPFLAISDVMLSDASSAIFEFLALNKPVIWCDFYKLRWSYRGIFSFRFKRRVDEDIKYFNDLCYRANSAEQLPELLAQALAESSSEVERRAEHIEKLTGALDGKASQRIVNYMRESV